MPNPPKPNELKRKLGNPGKRPLPLKQNLIALPMAHVIPEPLRPLGPEGKKMWDRIWDAGKNWISPSTDIEQVTILCESMDERVQLRTVVFRGGEWRDRVALRQLDHQITSMLSLIAFNPVDRSRLGLAEVQAVSRIQELMLRKSRGE
jgi:hypothetical protein